MNSTYYWSNLGIAVGLVIVMISKWRVMYYERSGNCDYELSQKSIWSLPLFYQQPLNNLSADLTQSPHGCWARCLSRNINCLDFECLPQVPPTLRGHPRVPVLWRYSLAIMTLTLLFTGLIGARADSVGAAVQSLLFLHSATITTGLALLRIWLPGHAKSHDSNDCLRIPLSGPWQFRAVCRLWQVVMTTFSSEHSFAPQMWQLLWRLLYIYALYSSEIPLQLAFSCRTVHCVTLERLFSPILYVRTLLCLCHTYFMWESTTSWSTLHTGDHLTCLTGITCLWLVCDKWISIVYRC